MKKVVAVAGSKTSAAHTAMAAEALEATADMLGYDIRVERRSPEGTADALSAVEIRNADVVILATDQPEEQARFRGKTVHRATPGEAIRHTARLLRNAVGDKGLGPVSELTPPPPVQPEPTPAPAPRAMVVETPAAPAPKRIETAFEEAAPPAGGGAAEPGAGKNLAGEVERLKAERSVQRAGPYKHLMTGVSYTIPVVVAGGLAIALSFMFGIDAAKEPGSLAAALMQIGGQAAFVLMVPVLSGFIAFSIADRPGLAPGLIGGMLANQIGAGFLGGLASGFLAGYIAYYLRSWIRMPQKLERLKPVLIIPLLASIAVGLLMIYVVGAPIAAILPALTGWLSSMTSANAVLLGLLLGGMMAVDMGGPVNKSAYTFAVGLLASEAYLPMAAVMAAGMTPPLGLALATMIAKNRFSPDERAAGKAAAVLGLSFITEGAIPFAAKDPLRVIPPGIVGSAVAGGLSMLFGCTLRATHGGIFVLGIPNAVTNAGLYALAIVAGSIVTAGLVIILKKPGTEATLGEVKI
jgi:fructose PTS system EIIBC or EIIC component